MVSPEDSPQSIERQRWSASAQALPYKSYQVLEDWYPACGTIYLTDLHSH